MARHHSLSNVRCSCDKESEVDVVNSSAPGVCRFSSLRLVSDPLIRPSAPEGPAATLEGDDNPADHFADCPDVIQVGTVKDFSRFTALYNVCGNDGLLYIP